MWEDKDIGVKLLTYIHQECKVADIHDILSIWSIQGYKYISIFILTTSVAVAKYVY